MASQLLVSLVAVLFCLSQISSEVADLPTLVQSAESTLQAAKTHVEHMLSLSPIPNEEKIPPIVKNETDHLAYEIKNLATELQQRIGVGEHKAEVKEAVNAAVTKLNEAATGLAHVGADLKHDNSHYFSTAEQLVAEIKTIVAVGPCERVAPLLRAALEELGHDVNNYQYGIHAVIGPHGGGNVEAGHEGHEHHHDQVYQHPRVHHHHSSSEEDSKSSEESHSHSH